MARPLRIEYPGAFYHIINRGQRQDAIVDDGYDRERFLCSLDEDGGIRGAALNGLLPKARLLSYCLKRMQTKPHNESLSAFLGSMKNLIFPKSYLGNSPLSYKLGELKESVVNNIPVNPVDPV